MCIFTNLTCILADFLVVFCVKVRVLSSWCVVSECATPAEVNKHLELGRDFLARGQLSDALTHYHAAVGECLQPLHTCTNCTIISTMHATGVIKRLLIKKAHITNNFYALQGIRQ